CATVQVPSDYDNPHGATTSIAMTRLPASNPDEKIGSLFLNFGGPGGPGVQNLHALGGSLFTDEVRAHFDVVAFDPRGVALSDPVTCFRDAETEQNFFAGMPAFPVGQKEELRTIAKTAALGVSCTVVSGDRIATSSTANVARDMDMLRQAEDDKKLKYVDYSYGTFLGATYGKLFPDRIRTMVLDGTVDPKTYVGKGDDRSLAAGWNNMWPPRRPISSSCSCARTPARSSARWPASGTRKRWWRTSSTNSRRTRSRCLARTGQRRSSATTTPC